MPPFTMHGNEELRPYQVDEQLHLFAAGVPRNMDAGNVLIQHIGSPLEQAVDDVGHCLFVAGNGMS